MKPCNKIIQTKLRTSSSSYIKWWYHWTIFRSWKNHKSPFQISSPRLALPQVHMPSFKGFAAYSGGTRQNFRAQEKRLKDAGQKTSIQLNETYLKQTWANLWNRKGTHVRPDNCHCYSNGMVTSVGFNEIIGRTTWDEPRINNFKSRGCGVQKSVKDHCTYWFPGTEIFTYWGCHMLKNRWLTDLCWRSLHSSCPCCGPMASKITYLFDVISTWQWIQMERTPTNPLPCKIFQIRQDHSQSDVEYPNSHCRSIGIPQVLQSIEVNEPSKAQMFQGAHGALNSGWSSQ